MNIEYYPEEIAKTLCNLAYDCPEEQIIKDCEEAIYNLKTIAENLYNSDFYRTMYKVFERIVEVRE